MAKPVRLVDIAERLNITKVSVSKALRNHPDISRATRELVKKTAAEMGYSPNLLARSLSSKKTNTLGVVVPKIAHTFFSSVIDAVQEEATAQGYGIVLAVSNERADLERQHIERLLAMRVDGLLVSVSQQEPDEAVYEKVRKMHVPLVFFDRALEDSSFSSVTVDDFEGARRAVQHVIDEGCSTIAHVGGAPETKIGRARLEGYKAALENNGIPIEASWIVEGGFDEHHGYRACKQILASGEVPEVIFAATFPVSLGVRAALNEENASLLDQVRLISFGAGGFDEFYMYPHYCVRQPTREMGVEAVRILLEEIDAQEADEPTEHQHVVLETAMIIPDEAFGNPVDGHQMSVGRLT